MTKEEFKQWAATFIESREPSRVENLKFVEVIKEHDKEAAAIASKMIKLHDDLADRLKAWLAENA